MVLYHLEIRYSQNSIFSESEYNHRTLFCRLNIGFASMQKTVDRIPAALIPILITRLATWMPDLAQPVQLESLFNSGVCQIYDGIHPSVPGYMPFHVLLKLPRRKKE